MQYSYRLQCICIHFVNTIWNTIQSIISNNIIRINILSTLYSLFENSLHFFFLNSINLIIFHQDRIYHKKHHSNLWCYQLCEFLKFCLCGSNYICNNLQYNHREILYHAIPDLWQYTDFVHMTQYNNNLWQ